MAVQWLTIPGLMFFASLVMAQEKPRKPHELYEAAESAYNDDRYHESLALLDECLRHFPGFYEGYALRASVRELLKDTDGALTDYSIYLEVYPDDVAVLMSRAMLRHRKGFHAQAREDLLHLLTLQPKETNVVMYRADPGVGNRSPVITPESGHQSYVYNYLGLTEARLGNHRQAIAYYDSALRLNPTEPDYYVNRGLSREALHDPDAAGDYRAALKLHNGHTLALHNLEAWQARQQQKDTTFEDRLTETILRDSTMLYPYLERAQQRYQGGYYKGAEEDYTDALDIDPRDPEIWLGRGLAREKQKNFEGAFADYTQAIELKNDFFKAWINRGNVLFRLGRYNAAIEDFTVALVYRDNHAPAYYNRAMARAKLKDYAPACDDLQRAESLGMEIEAKVKSKICEQ